MTKKCKRKDFFLKKKDIGRSAAEEDGELAKYYVDNEYWQSVFDFSSPISFFIGRKGIGRSALLQMIRLTKDSNSLINLSGDDFALEVISANPIFRDEIKSVSSPYELLYRTIWEYMILVRVLRKIYKEPSQWSEVINTLKAIVGKKVKKPIIDKFLERAGEIESEDMSFGETVLKLLEYIKPQLTYQLPDSSTVSLEVGKRSEEAEKKGISQLDIFKSINAIVSDIDEVLKHNKFYILIDDLDIDWRNEFNQNIFIKSLFKAIAKLMRSKKLRFVISLREDIFLELQLEDKDKFRDHIKMMRWNNTELSNILRKRLNVIYNASNEEITNYFFEGNVNGLNPLNYLASRSKTPRDMIQFGQICIDVATKTQARRINEIHILEAERLFSGQKLNDLSSEFQYKYRGLDNLLKTFHAGPKEFSLDELERKILEFIIEKAEGTTTQWVLGFIDNIREIIRILLNIGFLGYKKTKGDKAEFIMLEESPPQIGAKFWFAIHPVFERALDLY